MVFSIRRNFSYVKPSPRFSFEVPSVIEVSRGPQTTALKPTPEGSPSGVFYLMPVLIEHDAK